MKGRRDRLPQGPRTTAAAVLEGLCVLAAGLAAGAWFWRDVLASGFDLVSGDAGDNRLIIALHEHWYHVLGGREPWDQPLFFFPAKGVLAFSDTTFLASLPFSLARSFGADRYVAFQATLMAFTAVGFGSFYVLSRFGVGMAPLFALLGALAFAFSTSMSFTRIAAQNLYVCLAPVLSLLLLGFVRGLRRGSWLGLGYGLPFAVLLAAVYFSSFNFAWFFTFFVLLAGVIDLLLDPGLRSPLASRRSWSLSALVAATFLVALAPFIVTYAPMVLAGRGRSYEDVQSRLPSPGDFLNRSSDAWQAVLAHAPALTDLQQYGMTPILLFAVLVAGATLVVRRRGWTDAKRYALISVFLATLVSWLLMVKIDDASLWRFVFLLVPGATANRVVPRLEFVTTFFGCLVVFSCLDHAWRSARSGIRLLAVVLGLLIVAEQPASHSMDRISRQAELARLGGIPPPPPGAAAFFVIVPQPDAGSNFPRITAHIDAMLVAEDLGFPTVNGYSGWTPPGWGLGLPTYTLTYRRQVARFLASNGFRGTVVALDLAHRRWIKRPLS